MMTTLRPNDAGFYSYPAAGSQAGVVSETPNASESIIVTSITVSIATAAVAQGIIGFVLRDGVSGVGAIKWACTMAVLAGDSKQVALTGLQIEMTPGNIATLESNAAPVGTAQASCSMTWIRAGRIN